MKKNKDGYYIYRCSRINPQTHKIEYPKRAKVFRIWIPANDDEPD